MTQLGIDLKSETFHIFTGKTFVNKSTGFNLNFIHHHCLYYTRVLFLWCLRPSLVLQSIFIIFRHRDFSWRASLKHLGSCNKNVMFMIYLVLFQAMTRPWDVPTDLAGMGDSGDMVCLNVIWHGYVWPLLSTYITCGHFAHSWPRLHICVISGYHWLDLLIQILHISADFCVFI